MSVKMEKKRKWKRNKKTKEIITKQKQRQKAYHKKLCSLKFINFSNHQFSFIH